MAIPHFVLTFKTFGGVGELYRRRSPFMESFRCADNRPITTGEERERLVTASPVMTRAGAHLGVEQLPGERPRESAET